MKVINYLLINVSDFFQAYNPRLDNSGSCKSIRPDYTSSVRYICPGFDWVTRPLAQTSCSLIFAVFNHSVLGLSGCDGHHTTDQSAGDLHQQTSAMSLTHLNGRIFITHLKINANEGKKQIKEDNN